MVNALKELFRIHHDQTKDAIDLCSIHVPYLWYISAVSITVDQIETNFALYIVLKGYLYNVIFEVQFKISSSCRFC